MTLTEHPAPVTNVFVAVLLVCCCFIFLRLLFLTIAVCHVQPQDRTFPVKPVIGL